MATSNNQPKFKKSHCNIFIVFCAQSIPSTRNQCARSLSLYSHAFAFLLSSVVRTIITFRPFDAIMKQLTILLFKCMVPVPSSFSISLSLSIYHSISWRNNSVMNAFLFEINSANEIRFDRKIATVRNTKYCITHKYDIKWVCVRAIGAPRIIAVVLLGG